MTELASFLIPFLAGQKLKWLDEKGSVFLMKILTQWICQRDGDERCLQWWSLFPQCPKESAVLKSLPGLECNKEEGTLKGGHKISKQPGQVGKQVLWAELCSSNPTNLYFEVLTPPPQYLSHQNVI